VSSARDHVTPHPYMKTRLWLGNFLVREAKTFATVSAISGLMHCSKKRLPRDVRRNLALQAKDILQGIDTKLHVANTLQNFDLRFKDRRTIHVVAFAKRTAMASPARSPPVRCYHREPSRNGLRLRFRRKTM
jgi:hypothetical protein